jgi:hypothetical protein
MLRRWCILLAMVALTAGTALTASAASASALRGQAGPLGGWAWPPPGTGSWVPGGPINRGGLTFSRNSNQAYSLNWSGYAATGGTYTSVSASWVQPAVTCSSGDQYSAFWVGLDGYSSSTVEQTGTEADCDGKTAQYYAWYEMYPKASNEYSTATYPVKAGDTYTASVTYNTSNSMFTLTLDDTTHPWTAAATMTLSLPGAARSSAEVIAEAPCCTAFGGILPLADFGTVPFSNAVDTAGTATTATALGSASGVIAITMVDNLGREKDEISSSLSTPGGESFSMKWLSNS